MAEHVASRTLVKSTPELWAECSDPAALARHLGAFGEIRITKLQPETAVAWEGDDVSGTVTLEPAGWGTRVILTALEEGKEVAAGQGPPVVERAPVVEEPRVIAEEPRVIAEEPRVVAEEPRVIAEEPRVIAEEPRSAAQSPPPTEPPAVPRPGFLARLLARLRGEDAVPAQEDSGQEPPALRAPEDPPAVILRRRRRGPPVSPAPRPEPKSELEPAPDAEPAEPPAPQASALMEALDSLGRAHHRPYSRG